LRDARGPVPAKIVESREASGDDAGFFLCAT
jgi:hypothetical protein